MNTMLEIAAEVGRALAMTANSSTAAPPPPADASPATRRRLLELAVPAPEASRAARARTLDLVATVQQALMDSLVSAGRPCATALRLVTASTNCSTLLAPLPLNPQIVGESVFAGTQGLFAGAAVVDLASLRANTSTSYSIGTGGAVVTPLDSFATPLPLDSKAIQLRFTHQPNASLLMDCGFSSTAVVPGGAFRRRSLLAVPQVTGALSTTVMSGEVSVTSTPGGSGAVDVALPLTAAYVPDQVRRGGWAGALPGAPPAAVWHLPVLSNPPPLPLGCSQPCACGWTLERLGSRRVPP